ncbi:MULTISPECIES: prepilin-type N-terminal cleavage/methylation domain-containing protein [unclassified Pseudomonas]|uniref:PilW family protein n=1 Tax=unclassified Pseudomonas TaxID=196821 RepID=UPI0024470B29|nr:MULTISPECIES: prepilin-type N-terminal cleavage/methylation domain-containing protein [unclassified Pseudomonas]MDH0896116.1 prepilin-type N-terminal cleavage/methylation domain-containing protein [Pseudomonas sp. GD03875]MDH1064789.1 prepilin-type N-terminal cleavage/methylation domain-containing protein [Pseudomonas sp. GD03985]
MFPTSFRNQRGLSMVELMVALAVSSFLILGVTQIFIDNKRNYLYQQGQGENLENGRFALMLLGERLSKAGYRRNPVFDMETAFPAQSGSSATENCDFAAGQAVVRVDDATLCLRYQPKNDSETDCLGNTFSGGSDLEAPYDVNGRPDFDTNEIMIEKFTLEEGTLKCNGQELVGNIDGLYFDYGVNDDAYTLKVDSYTATPDASETIRALRYSVLLIATPNNLTQGIDSKVCTNPDNEDEVGDWENLTGQSLTCEAGKLYQMASGSSTLRNLMP